MNANQTRQTALFESHSHDNAAQEQHRELSPLTRVACLCLVLLVLAYHANHAVGEAISGSTEDDNILIAWEYDLETGIGSVLIQNLAIVLEGPSDRIELTGLIPQATLGMSLTGNLSLDPPCESEDAPEGAVYANLDPGEQGKIVVVVDNGSEGQCPIPPKALESVAASSAYRQYVVTSAIPCDVILAGELEFLSVAPLHQECACLVPENQSSFDLEDVAEFQRNFVHPTQLSCLLEFPAKFDGPGE